MFTGAVSHRPLEPAYKETAIFDYAVVYIYTTFGPSGLFSLISIGHILMMVSKYIEKGLIENCDNKLQVIIGKISAGDNKIYISQPFLYGRRIDHIDYLVTYCQYFHIGIPVMV